MSFLEELEVAVSRGAAESRQRALWYATDLLIAGRYTDDEIWMFGEIIARLEQEIEAGARAQLAKRLISTDVVCPNSTPYETLQHGSKDDRVRKIAFNVVQPHKGATRMRAALVT